MRLGLVVATIAMGLALTSCAPTAPVEQVQLFAQALGNAQTASQPLFDDLAAAERDLGKHVAVAGAQQAEADATTAAPATAGVTTGAPADSCRDSPAGWQSTGAKDAAGHDIGFLDKFCSSQAAYFANIGDPPATRQFRSALLILGQYSDLLLTLAEGRNIDQAKADLQSLGASVAGTLALIPQAAPAAAAIGPLLTALGPVIDEAAKAQNFKEMRRIVAAAEPHFGALIDALQAGTPAMFDTLTRAAARRVPVETRQNPALAAAVVGQIEGYRTAVANFVLLLDEVRGAHGDIVAALAAAENAPLTLSVAADRAQRLNAQANALRAAFVILRRGPA